MSRADPNISPRPFRGRTIHRDHSAAGLFAAKWTSPRNIIVTNYVKKGMYTYE
jgi:hypothetical protein